MVDSTKHFSECVFLRSSKHSSKTLYSQGPQFCALVREEAKRYISIRIMSNNVTYFIYISLW